jgi:hypothetical protein
MPTRSVAACVAFAAAFSKVEKKSVSLGKIFIASYKGNLGYKNPDLKSTNDLLWTS